jgi:hypothetical protein
MLLPAECHEDFRGAYAGAGGAGGADGGTWTRARGWALVLGLACLANSADNPLIASVGERTIRAVLA